MQLSRRRRTVLATLAVALPALLLVGPLAALAQEVEFVEEVDLNNAECFGHHAAETPPFRTTVLIAPAPVLEVPAGEEFDLPVQVQVAWKQEMQNLKIGLNLSQAPNLGFLGERAPEEVDFPGETIALQGSAEFPFMVEENATEVVVSMVGDEGPHGGHDLDLFLLNPRGESYNKTIEDNTFQGVQNGAPIADEEMRVDQPTILDGGLGEWKALVSFPASGVPGGDGIPLLPAATTTFDLAVRVYYNSSRVEEVFIPVGRTLAAGEATNVTFRLIAKEAGPVVLGVRSLGNAHYLHTDAQANDNGNFSKTVLYTFAVGDELVFGEAGAGLVDVGFDPATRLLRQWGFLLGWLGFFLIPPSLVLGGTFGSRTVRAMNRAVGSARQRVLWHNALSYVLLGVGLVHMVVFLLEVTYHWTVGIVWGTLTLASMIGLGVTGALQTKIAKTWGYGTWRFTHFLLGMLVVVGIALHVVVDGVDFQFLRDYFLATAP